MDEARAQNKPSVIEWDYSSPSTIPGFENDDNWALSIKQLSDGNFVVVGFSDQYGTGATTNRRHPSILKYNPGRQIVWEKIPTYSLGITLADSYSGGFKEVFEVAEGNSKYIYAVGNMAKTLSSRTGVIGKFDLNSGNLIYFSQLDLGTNDRIDIMSAAPKYASNGNLEAIYGCGTISISGSVPKAAVLKIKPDGSFDTSFNGTGYKLYDLTGAPEKRTEFIDITQDGTAGFVMAGAVLQNEETCIPNNDAFIVKIDNNGNVVWQKTYDEDLLEGMGIYTDVNQSQEIDFCDDNDPNGGDPAPETTETANEVGYSIEKMSDGGFAIYSRFDFINRSAEGCLPGGDLCWPFNTEQYYDCDMAIVKIKEESGVPVIKYALDAGRSAAIDFWSQMAKDGANLYLLGAFFEELDLNNPVDDEIWGSVVKVEDRPNQNKFVLRWRKDFKGLTWEYCPFGICVARDGGIVTCGNNANNGDDYEIIKLGSPCQPNTTGPLSNSIINGTPTWSTDQTIKGLVTIPSGAKLTIQGATIQFHNTYLLNDYTTLAAGGGTPVKIIVSPGGELVLDNCVLKGLTSCGRDWMWEGIEVLGQPTLSPTTTNQGKITMINNARIENAYVGITVGKRVYNSLGRSVANGTEGGGIVNINQPSGNSMDHFKNCRFSLWFAPYTYSTNINTTIANTHFKCDAPLADVNYVSPSGIDLGSAYFAGSWNRDRLIFNNCTFENTGTFPATLRGTGISSYDAKITVTGGKFGNIDKGIYAAYGGGVTDPLTVTGVEFKAVRYGINTLGGAFHLVSGSSFLDIPESLLDADSYAMRFDGSSNIIVADGNNVTATTPGVYGVITTASGNASSLISDNTFSGLAYGVQTQEDNSGAQIRCNSYDSNNYSWSINPQSQGTGLFSDQGLCGQFLDQAGNVFNDPDCPGGTAQSHIKSNLAFQYRFRSGINYANEEPTCVSSLVEPEDCGGDFNPTLCSFGLIELPCDPCTEEELQGIIDVESNAWKKELYQNLLVRLKSENNNYSGITTTINDMASDDTDILLAGTYINKGDYTNASAKVANLSLLDPEQSAYKSLYQILIDLGQNGLTVMDMDATQEQTVKLISDGTTRAKYPAQAIREVKNDILYPRTIEKWSGNLTEGNEDRSQSKFDGNDYSNSLSVNPNPASNIFTITWSLVATIPDINNIRIIDINGKVVKEILIATKAGSIDISAIDFMPGVYFIVLPTNKSYLSEKIIILK